MGELHREQHKRGQLEEILVEAEEDSVEMSDKIAKLSDEVERLTTELVSANEMANQESSATASTIHQLETANLKLTEEVEQSKEDLEEIGESNKAFGRAIEKLNVEEARYEQELEVAGNILFELKEEKAALVRALDKVTQENADMKRDQILNEPISREAPEDPSLDSESFQALKDKNLCLQNALTDANTAYNIIWSLTTSHNMDALTAENAHLKDDLAEARAQLNRMVPVMPIRSHGTRIFIA